MWSLAGSKQEICSAEWQHSLTEQIEADRYLASKQAANSKPRGLRLSRLVPPGAQ
ncbi:MAG: hypothetical protein AB7I48_11625 [Planctomycetaceae bacterium]